MNTLLALILVLYLEQLPAQQWRFLDRCRAWRRSLAWNIYLERCCERWSGSRWMNHWLGVAWLLLPLPLLVGFFQWILGENFGFLTVFFNVMILFLCLRTQDNMVSIERSTLEHRVEEKVWNRVDGQYAILWWFMLLGPFGSVLYRLSSLFYHHPVHQASLSQEMYSAHYLLAWLPARMTAFLFALVGAFHPTQTIVLQGVVTPMPNEALIRDAALSAVGSDNQQNLIIAIEHLLQRTGCAWVVTLMILFLAGWTF